ncbi:MAG: hypothetical protein AABW46_03505 [Nanoarchaeota archaeon]
MQLSNLKRGTISLIASIPLYLGSCVPSSEIERTVEAVIEDVVEPVLTGEPPSFIPDFPPYVPEEPLPTGNDPYPKRIVEWDDSDNVNHLIEKKCNDSGYTTIRGSGSLNAVVNAILLEYDHKIRENIGAKNDVHLELEGDYSDSGSDGPISFGVYLALRKGLVFKSQNKKEFSGWEKYSFFPIWEFNGYLGPNSLDFEVNSALQEAWEETSLLAILNHGNNPLKVKCLTTDNQEPIQQPGGICNTDYIGEFHDNFLDCIVGCNPPSGWSLVYETGCGALWEIRPSVSTSARLELIGSHTNFTPTLDDYIDRILTTNQGAILNEKSVVTLTSGQIGALYDILVPGIRRVRGIIVRRETIGEDLFVSTLKAETSSRDLVDENTFGQFSSSIEQALESFCIEE